MLYPLKFKPRFKERIWGGRQMAEKLGKKLPKNKWIGESWEIADIGRDVSVVANGFLAGNNLRELVEVYMGDLVGDKVYDRFGQTFPLLIKYIDARDRLSVQVHPDDALAAERHASYGKTEMWYVVDCEPGAELCVGFREEVSREEYLRRTADGTLSEVLALEEVHPEDAFFIPAGTVHYIGAGLLLAEIQQTSDVTYRIFDWGRTDVSGRSRELHTDLAADAIDYGAGPSRRITRQAPAHGAVRLEKCPYFTTNLVGLDGSLERSYVELDSFVVYMLTEGEATLRWHGASEKIGRGETVLLPACIETVTLEGKGRLLEIYID